MAAGISFDRTIARAAVQLDVGPERGLANGSTVLPASQPQSPPVVLSIAGSDNSAGAGVQADLKTFSALGVYGVTAITCVVAEVPHKVSAIQPVEPPLIAEQIRLLFEAFPIAAAKTGMLHSRQIMQTVCETIEDLRFRLPASRCPLVVDPVMIATSGASLLQPDAIALYRDRLFPQATVITPNLDEAGALLGRPVQTLEEMRHAAEALARQFGVACLLKGGHLRSGTATDLLFAGNEMHEFSAPFVPDVSTHGTGCTYSAAIAAGLGKGLALRGAVAEAKRFVTDAVTHFLRWHHRGATTDALHHFARSSARVPA
jgi:hydroxymethylpyrimidine/phosphomethylpyrimidine kinase